MPENIYEWAWFTFFTVGALGGWLFWGIFAYTLWDEFKKRRVRTIRGHHRGVFGDE
jgi:hypothetical protein